MAAAVQTTPLLEYTASEAIALVDHPRAIFHLAARGRYLYLSLSGKEIVAYNLDTRDTLILLQHVFTHEIESSEQGIYFCTDQGIFLIDPADPITLRQLTPTGCYAVEPVGADSLYFTGLESFEGYHPDRIFQLVRGTVSGFSPPVDFGLVKFARLANGEFFAYYGEGGPQRTVRISEGGEMLQVFEPDGYPFREYNSVGKTWMTPTADGLIMVGKNGFGYPNLISWSMEEEKWTDLVIPQAIEEKVGLSDEKLRYLRTPSYTDVLSVGDRLLVTTTLAGCVGVHRFALSSDEALTYEDIDIVRDANFTIDGCLQGFSLDRSTGTLYVYSQQEVMQLTLPN